jgi:hypothetical protein
MAEKLSETEEKQRFIARVKKAREGRFSTQRPMYELLELDQGTYKQYETRSYLPPRFYLDFCRITGVRLEWLCTGVGKMMADLPGPSRPPEPPKRPRKAA